MALPATGAISFANINTELGRVAGAAVSLGETAVRTLFGQAAGAVDMNTGHGKANRVAVSLSIASGVANFNIFNNKGGSYIAGKTDITLTINSGAYVYSAATNQYALDTGTGWTAGDTIKIINNGTIVGRGGAGGAGGDGNSGTSGAGGAGGPALIAQAACSITNNGTIGGGGNGGAGGIGSPSGSDKVSSWPATPGAGGSGGAGFGAAGAGTPSGNAGTLAAGGAAVGDGVAGGALGSGAAVAGNANITWVAVGTRYGAIA